MEMYKREREREKERKRERERVREKERKRVKERESTKQTNKHIYIVEIQIGCWKYFCWNF